MVTLLTDSVFCIKLVVKHSGTDDNIDDVGVGGEGV